MINGLTFAATLSLTCVKPTNWAIAPFCAGVYEEGILRFPSMDLLDYVLYNRCVSRNQ